MADRHVKVTLSANVRDYTRSVQNAANETDQLRRSAERFDGKTYRAHLDVKIDKAALAQMALLQGQLGRFDGKTYRARVDVDRKSLDDLLSHLTLVDTSIARVARSWRGFAFTGLAALSPQMSSLAHAAVQAAGALGLLPAVGFAAAGGIGAVAIGVMGMKDALKNLGEDPKKFAELVKDLAPSARQTAIELNNLSGKWKELQQHVQQELFEGVAQRVDKLGSVYLPVLKDALGGIASEMGDAANAFMDFAAKAETVKDARHGLDLIRQSADSIAPVMVNLSQIFRDVAVVGATFLPQLGRELEIATDRWAQMVSTARETGRLADIIHVGIERVKQFGSVLYNTGGMLTGVFRAADTAGYDFLSTLERLTRQAHEFIDSARGQQEVANFFRGLGDVIRSITPGLGELARMVGEVFAVLSRTGTLTAAGQAFSALAAEARPVVVALAELAGTVLPPLLRALEAMAPVLGPVVAGFVALRAIGPAAAAISGVGAAMAGAAINAGVFTERLTGSAVAGERVMTTTDRMGRALDGIGRALPVIGAAVIGLAWMYEEFGSKADDSIRKVIQGTMTLEQAIEAEIAQVEKNTLWWASATQEQNAHAAARQRVTEEFRKQYEALTPLQRAQADVAMAQARFNQLLFEAGMRSQETRNALEDLRAKSRELEIQQIMVAEGVDRATAAMLYQRDAAREATNADIALERATINLEYAQQRATEATREHGAESLQARDANLNLREATLRVAEAAGEKARRDAEATGASDGARRAAEAQRLKYLELAANTKDPLRTELLQLADQLRTLPDGNFTVTGTGKTSFQITNTGEVIGGPPGVPITGRASGGVLPGWSPGKDVHTFTSPTGGILRLSGGEAVMRPEFTRAVGTGWIDTVNRAARVGGTSGVARALTGGESNSGAPTQAFASGGVFINGPRPMRKVAKDGDDLVEGPNWNHAAKNIVDTLAPKIAEYVKWLEEGWWYGGGAGAEAALQWARSQAGKPYVWGGVGPRGYDCSGFMSAIMNVMDGRNPHSRRGSTGTMPWSGMRPGFGPGLSVGNTKNAGGGIGHMAGTLLGVNVESRGGRGVLVGPAARGARHSLFNSIYHYVGRGGVAAPGSAGRGDAGIGGSGVQRWAGVVSQALAIMGQPQSYLGITLRRMNQESGGRVNVVNTWDINAKRGTPSVGLMQVIRPTYAAYKHPAYDRGPYLHGVSIDPLANILASMRYAIARYGSLPKAYNRPGGYDEGGLAVGKGLLAKYTVAPERVLSPRQTAAFERLVPIAEALARGNAAVGATVVKNYNLTIQNAGNSTVDLQAQFKRLEMMSGV